MGAWKVWTGVGIVVIAVLGAGLPARGDVVYVATSNGIGRVNANGTFDVLVPDPGDGSVVDGMAFDAAGNLYFSKNGSPGVERTGSIERMTPGGVVSLFRNQGLDIPQGLAFDKAGNLFVANARDDAIIKITPEGVSLPFAKLATYSLPAGIVLDASENLYVSTSYGFDKITPAGVVSEFPSSPAGPDSYYSPRELAIDGQGNLYEEDKNGGVFKFAPDGTHTTFATNINTSPGIAINAAGNILVSPVSTLLELTTDGVEVGSIHGLPYQEILEMVVRPEASVPEPGTATVLGAAAMMGVCRRRRGH